jgi:hypothetical protein
MRKFVFCILVSVVTGVVFGQKAYDNGVMENLPWGSSVALFQSLYPEARETTSDDNRRQGIRAFSLTINPIRGQIVQYMFYKDQFYRHVENHGRLTSENIGYLLRETEKTYGRFDFYNEYRSIYGPVYDNIIHYSETLEIKGTTIDSGNSPMFIITYNNPKIIAELDGSE